MCEYCRQNQPTNMISISAPGFWVKLKIEAGKLLFAYDKVIDGMRQAIPIRFCPMCGEELKR